MRSVKSLFFDHHVTLLVFSCVLAVYGLSVYKQEATYQDWQADRETYVVGPVTAMTTMDAYHWLKMARDLDDGKLGKGLRNVTKAYPDLTEYQDANLLALLISFGKRWTGGDYYRSGLLLVSVLGGLFVFPLFFYCHRLGFGAAAVMGGLIGIFSRAYYERSAMGNLDTDLLNLFFPLALACFILLIDRARPLRANLGLAGAAGITMYLYNWWYEQPGIMLVYLLCMVLYLALSRLPWQHVLWTSLVFVLASGPNYALHSVDSVLIFLGAYFSPAPSGRIVWPDVMLLIAEAQKPGAMTALNRVHGLMPLVLAGFAGLLFLYIRHFRRMIPITPPLLLGLWSLTGPIRFAMYLAPFIGVGVGVLILLLVARAGKLLRVSSLPTTAVSLALMGTLFFSTSAHTWYAREPKPMLTAATTRAILEIKQRVPAHSAMLTWWDMGYPLMEIGEFATYHDGSFHGGLRTTLIGKALASPRQEEMVALLAYLEDYGFDPLAERIAAEDLTGAELEQLVFAYPGPFRGENVYLLYTEDMIRKFGSITESGMWDFTARKSDWVFYERWNCDSRDGNRFRCREGVADLDRGVIGDGIVEVPLNTVVYVNDGYEVRRQDYRTGQKYNLQILMKNKQIFQVQVVDVRLFETNFNQQFVLGHFDRNLFAEVYNDFPVARVLRVLPQ